MFLDGLSLLFLEQHSSYPIIDLTLTLMLNRYLKLAGNDWLMGLVPVPGTAKQGESEINHTGINCKSSNNARHK